MLVLPYISVKNPLSQDDESKDSKTSSDSSQQNDSNNSSPKYSNLRTLFPVLLIVIALPLVVLFSLQRQNIKQNAASINCNNGLTCTACVPGSNTCSYGNGTQSCTYTTALTGEACNPVTFNNVLCFKSNCSTGSTCTNQQCVSNNVPTATKTPTPTPASISISPASGRKSKTINASQSELLAALADKSIDDIIIGDGVIQGGFSIGGQYSGTAAKPRTVKAKNKYGVKINGPYTEGIQINNGASYLTLDGFEFTNANVGQGGCIVFGTEGNPSYVAAHHINLLNMKVGPTIKGPAAKGSTNDNTGHALYIGAANGEGHHNIVADGWDVDGGDNGLASGFHMYHSSSGRNNGHDIQIKNWTIRRVNQAIILWDSTIYNITIGPNIRIYDSSVYAVRYEYGSRITFNDVISVNSASQGFYSSSSGNNPSGITFQSTSLK